MESNEEPDQIQNNLDTDVVDSSDEASVVAGSHFVSCDRLGTNRFRDHPKLWPKKSAKKRRGQRPGRRRDTKSERSKTEHETGSALASRHQTENPRYKKNLTADFSRLTLGRRRHFHAKRTIYCDKPTAEEIFGRVAQRTGTESRLKEKTRLNR